MDQMMEQTAVFTPIQDDEHMIAAPGEAIVNITAFTARQQVSGYVGSYISHLMGGAEPSLILSQNRLRWRVPILFTSPDRGPIGIVGNLDVDARTGQLLVPDNFVEKLEANAQALVESSPS
jgi:hypothetical protein